MKEPFCKNQACDLIVSSWKRKLVLFARMVEKRLKNRIELDFGLDGGWML